jgi:ribosomal protein L14E/L6E/L27E
MKFLKVGRVAIVTRGRYAGKKVNPHLSRAA